MSFFNQDLGYNTLDRIIKHTYDEFYNEIKDDLKSFVEVGDSPIKRALNENPLDKLLFKVQYSDQAERLGNKYHKYSLWQESTQQRDFFKERNIEINKIESQLTIEEALPVIQSIRTSVGNKFFGAILVKNGEVRGRSNATINPLNPLVAIALKEAIDNQEKTFLKNEYSIIVYTIKDTEIMNERISEEPISGYEDDIKDIMVAAHLSENITIEYENVRRVGTKTIRYDEIRRDANGNRVTGDNSMNFMLPVQISNVSGMMYPCYGTVLFQGRNAKNLSPHMSANVGVPGQSDGSWSNACTGSLNSGTDAGKISLNHSNNTSPLNSRNFGKGSVKYAQACTDIALQLLTGTEVAVEAEPEIKRMTLVEYKAENEGASISEYIEYIRALNIAELPAWE